MALMLQFGQLRLSLTLLNPYSMWRHGSSSQRALERNIYAVVAFEDHALAIWLAAGTKTLNAKCGRNADSLPNCSDFDLNEGLILN